MGLLTIILPPVVLSQIKNISKAPVGSKKWALVGFSVGHLLKGWSFFEGELYGLHNACNYIHGFAIMCFSAIIAYQAWKNGRWMKMAHNETRVLVKGTQELIKAVHQDVKETREMTKKLGNLIVADGERTRELVRQMKS